MARKKHKGVTKYTEPRGASIVVQELNVMSADRHYKDIGEFKNSLRAAESIHYPNRTRLYDLYDDVMIDGHLTGVIEKRIDDVLNKNLFFENSAKKRIDDMDDVINSDAFRDVIRQILLSKMWGVSGMEFLPGPELCFEEIPRKHIKPHKKVIAREQNDEDGIPYENLSNFWVIGKPKDLGLLLKASLYAIYKRGALGDWAQYIEIFGQPVRVAYYDAYDTKTKAELRKVLDESGSSLALMIPKQAQFEMKDGKQSNGDGKLQHTLMAYLDDQISIIILGNTETTQASSSSGYAQSKEHGKQQLQITKSDLKFVRNMLNSPRFLSILKSYALPVEGGRFVYEKEVDLTQLENRLKIDDKVSQKVPVGDDYWYETYGIPKPDNYDELKAQQEEERQARLNPPAPAPGRPAPGRPKPKGKGKMKLSAWDDLRRRLADFFDPAV